ncbi:N,N-dimethylformamidase beta subunit family domain-containing protein [Hymenobacter sp. GOD-10R]|uniref:N,N-dimethylformamidase beta subunit family domain-containing protein n=1 Tax=Hymenobacter sp. GOD-10R TaxID=3093922 RepID=UPI002D7703A7|nr:N,N-dimethylformamidase beta subunit family domain-containing protein [Hymenobacter sp. GOD-10R]WRQ27714.1 N,N-dimethylformamidase beta subunit family domain-containing protein [Hymenobacter sp. GOD-10R]
MLAQNAIVTENAQTGALASEWDVSGAGDLSIQGFATDISYNVGETARFKIKTNATGYTIRIYRLGYYQGRGARFITQIAPSAPLPQTQPLGNFDATTGLLDCGNWAESASWAIPSSAVSGIYIAKLTRTDTQGASHIVFVVRNDASTSDLLFQTSDATWQAYNVYGDNNNGKSLYTGAGGKASKVSYNRPFLTRSGGGGGGAAEDWLFNSEYPMLRWLEANGYDMTYSTDVDTDRRGNLLLQHKVFMSVGHDEYWSGAARDNVTAARNAGKHLAFFGGNEVYWKTRWENNNRTLVCYKEGGSGENACSGKCDPSPEWTGQWRSGCNFPTAGGCRPENELSGQISWSGDIGTIQVPATYKNLRFWRNTSVAALGAGQTATLTPNTLGYEWNPYQEQFKSTYPSGRIVLSQTTLNGKVHQLSIYKHSSGALVFGAGTVQWSWGLDSNHDRGNDAANPAMQQATLNLFADMGVQPATRQAGLVAATASTDAQAPTVAITSPAPNASLPSGTAVTITGTATDANAVAGVEVSTDGGTTWNVATGTTSWTFAWTPTTQGAATIRSRAFDDSGNMSAPVVVAVTVTGPNTQVCPCTVFQPTEAPANNPYNDNQAIQLGMRFRASSDGYITGARFYKQSGNTGTHTAQLYNNAGVLLAEAVFTSESASGWQEVPFPSAVAVTANTTYVISYHSSAGNYSATNPGFDVAKVNGPLRGLANGEDGANGVYKYSATPAFPTDNYQTSNYWVDVVFNTTGGGADTTPPTVVSTSPIANAGNVSITPAVTVTFNEALDPATVNTNTLGLFGPGNAPVSASVSYNASSRTATLSPTGNLAYSTAYTVRVKGGTTDPRIKDAAGNALAADYTWSFTTRSAPPAPLPSPNDGPGGPILVISSTANPFSRFPVEILRAEGFNEFAARDIAQVDNTLLNAYDVVVLGDISVSPAQVTMLTNWVTAGGTLIALRPNAQLAPLLGLNPANGTLSDKYLLVNTASGPGVGIVDQTMQFHGTADLYTLNGATALATLYSGATAATTNPAVTTKDVGPNGGKAIAFTYDLARSVVYTRQGNPAWAGQKRDGEINPIRSDDMFFPDWIDFNKVTIPQADEQQRLLANIIVQSNLHRKPLPRFWYLPRGLKAAVVMTGDDHGNGGTKGRFDGYIAKSSSNTAQAVADWTAIRGTSYIYPGTPITDAQAAAYEAQGFEIGLHLNTDCNVWTPTSLRNYFDTQLPQLASQLPSISATSTLRTHCISWSDWATQPKAEVERGIRLDANYYYWPAAWIQNRPGMFTGSGMPMRFADTDGSLIDCYQATTQLTDESGITYSTHINTLLDNALGAKGYYGVFTANMHTDLEQVGTNSTDGSNTIIAAAQQRQVPVISAKQMLTWLDGRNNSSFGTMTWNGNALNFSITTASGSNNLRAMLPLLASVGQLTGITVNGSAVTYTTETIKGIQYAFFPANGGNYVASYSTDNTPPVISAVAVAQPSSGGATITWTTNKPSDSKVVYGTTAANLNLTATTAGLVTSHSVALSSLAPSTTYYYRVVSVDAQSNTTTEPNPPAAPLSFTTPAAPPAVCFQDQTSADFTAGTTGANIYVPAAGGVLLKPQVAQEFTAAPPTTEWQSFPWNGGGATTFSGGQAVVDGARFNTEPVTATSGPGTSVEFVATFGAAPFQHVGFGAGNDVDMFNNTPIWAMFSTGSASTSLIARVNNNGTQTDVPLPGNLLGTAHRYRIDWKASSIDFYVDGTLAQTTNVALSTPMRVGASDYNVGGPAVSLDWVRISPYASPGSFTSRVYDGGSAKTWGQASWQADVPTGTGLQLLQRQGNTAVPDGTWTPFAAIASNGATVGGTSRYIQYRADLSTSTPTLTPTLQSLGIACSTPACATVVFTPATGTALPAGTVGTAYSQTISTAPTGYTYSATGLPTGLSIDQNSGVISGTPSAVAANAAIVVTATQGACTATASYTLTVTPASTLRVPENPANAVAGLDYKYYEGFWNTLPNFGTLTPTKTGTVTTPTLAVALRDNGFGFQYTGYVTVPEDGQYTFSTTSDDGSQLYIGSTLVVDNDGLHGDREVAGSIGLQAGTHALTITFFENDGGQTLQVTYAGPSLTKQVIPASAYKRVPITGANQAPIANAGPNQSITLPTSSVTLNGTASTDPDGTIATYLWSQASGPNNASFSSTSAPTPTVSGLVAGTYIFSVVVTDNLGLQSTPAQVSIIVNASGTLRTPENPANTVAGLDYKYYEGFWEAVPNFSTLTPLKTGTTTAFELTAQQRDYGFAFQFTGYVTVPQDGIYTFYTNSDDGSLLYIGSTLVVDNDGSHDSRERTGTIGLKAGTHAFKVSYLQGYGSQNLQVSYAGPSLGKQFIPASALRRVSGTTSTNQPPVANAGSNQSITLPQNSTSLSGSGTDTDGTITGYTWSQVSGPNTATFSSKTVFNPIVSGLVAGTYVFGLVVTDNLGANSAISQVSVTVNANNSLRVPENPANTVAGLDYKYYEGFWDVLPNFASLTPLKSGSTTAIDLNARQRDYGYAFQYTGYVTVPTDGQYTFFTTSDDGSQLLIGSTVVVNNDGLHDTREASGTIGLQAGTHAFTVTYFQNGGGQNLTVSYQGPSLGKQVIPASSLRRVAQGSNQPPVANAGSNQSITLPQNSTQLSGSGTDADGPITAYTWSQVSGPNTATFSSKTIATPTVSGLVAGTYVFGLVVTDNLGANSAISQVSVTVNANNSLRVPENPANTVAGLDYKYYEGFWDVLPNFPTLTPVKTGTIATPNLSVASRNYGYAIQYTGYVTVPVDGQYTFFTSSDDGSRLYIGSTLVVDNDGLHDTKERLGTIGLQAGTHAFTVAFFQNGGGENLTVSYQGPSLSKQVIPASALRRVVNGAAATTATAGVLQTSVSERTQRALLEVYPNPLAEESGLVHFHTLQGGKAQVYLYNDLGELISTLYNAEVVSGQEYYLPLSRGNLASGVYLLRLISNGKVENRRLTITR